MKKTSYNIHWKEKNIILYHKLISLMNLKLHQVCRYSFNEKDRELNIKRVCIHTRKQKLVNQNTVSNKHSWSASTKLILESVMIVRPGLI